MRRNVISVVLGAFAGILGGCMPGEPLLIPPAWPLNSSTLVVELTVELGPDVGQHLGSLFEARKSSGEVVLGAGFQACSNTRYPQDSRRLCFFVKPVDDSIALDLELLPRVNDSATSVYLFSAGEELFARDNSLGLTYTWSAGGKAWERSINDDNELPFTVDNDLLCLSPDEATYRDQVVFSNEDPETRATPWYYGNGFLIAHTQARLGPRNAARLVARVDAGDCGPPGDARGRISDHARCPRRLPVLLRPARGGNRRRHRPGRCVSLRRLGMAYGCSGADWCQHAVLFSRHRL